MTQSSAESCERSQPVGGARLVTETMPQMRSVAIGFWVDAGARDEPEEIAGAAHMLEHLLFKGTSRRSAQEIANTFEEVGGELNAYSAREHTCFYARVLDEDVEMAIDVICDMYSNGALSPDDLESERRVVLEEIRMAADVPEDWVHDLFSAAAFPSHPLGRAIIGTEETVTAMDRERLSGFYRDAYVADRLVVSAAGSVSHDQLANLLAHRLKPGSVPIPRTGGTAPRFGGPNAVYAVRESEQAHIVWGLEAMGRDDPDRYALGVLNDLYGGGVSSRLFQEIREKRGLAYSIYSGHNAYLETGLFSVYVGVQPESAAEVLTIARDQAADVCGGGLSAEEVDRAKGHVRGGLIMSMDDPGGRMSRIGRSELVHGEVPAIEELIGRIEAVTVEDVSRVAKRLFAAGGSVLACVGPVPEGSLDFAVGALGD